MMVNKVYSVDIACKNITSLLDVNWNLYTDDINKIIKLDCSENEITSFDGIPPNIQILDCSDNKITSFNRLPPNLKELYCSFNQITSFVGLPPNLQKLDCSDNEITNVIGLPQNLQILDCANNKITDFVGCPEKFLLEIVSQLDPEIVAAQLDIDIVIKLLYYYNTLKNENNTLKDENNTLKNEIKKQNEFIEHLKYSPVGYEQAKEDFNMLKNHH